RGLQNNSPKFALKVSYCGHIDSSHQNCCAFVDRSTHVPSESRVVPIFLDPHAKDMEQLTDFISAADEVMACPGAIPFPNGAGAKQLRPPRPSEPERASYARCGRHLILIEFGNSYAISHRTTKNPK